MKRKNSIRVSVLFLVTITAVFLLPQTLLADYSFWYGTEVTQKTMLNPNYDPTKPPGPTNPPTLTILPGMTETEANDLAQAVLKSSNNLFFSMLFFTNNPKGETGTTIWEKGKTWNGYTLLSLLQGYQPEEGGPTYNAVLVDMDGTVVNKWQLTGFPSKMLPGGSVIGGKGAFNELIGVPYLVQQDWCGNDQWVWEGNVGRKWQAEKNWTSNNNRCYDFDGDGVPDAGPYSDANPLGCNEQPKIGDWLVSGWHHDFQREGNPVGYYAPLLNAKTKNGKTLVLANYLPPTPETCPDPNAEGCISKYRLYDEAIYILDWNGNVVFEWFPYQHFNEMGFLPKAREAIRETRSGAGNNENANDYQHFNNVNWVGPNKWYTLFRDQRFNPEYIIWDARSSNITAIIATSDHPKGEWKKGDIVWKVGPNYQVPFDPEFKLGQIIGQHHAHMIPSTLPGGGNILLFDNGGGAGWGPVFEGAPLTYTKDSPLDDPSRAAVNSTMRNFSRVIEFNPRTMEIVWQYAQPNPTADVNGDGNYWGDERLFFSFFISSAQRLQNGNTMITEGATGRIFEVTKDNKVVWEFISPFRGGGSGLGFIGAVYRSYRVPYSWAPKNKNCP